MKKFLAILMTLVLVAACGTALAETADVKGEGAMTYAEYAAAEIGSDVVIETYVQAHENWWNGVSLYTQDQEGGYFIYSAACTEEDAAKLVAGTKIRVTGVKTEWSGLVEIEEGATVEILEAEPYVAEAVDATALLASEELINYQNMFVSFKGMTIEPIKDADGNEHAFLYKWDGSGEEGTDSDLYFNASIDGQTYTFVFEYYLCDANGAYGADHEAYKAIQALNIGDKVDMAGYLYWYNGVEPHICSVTPAAE